MHRFIFIIALSIAICGFTEIPKAEIATIHFLKVDDSFNKLKPENRPRMPDFTIIGNYDDGILSLMSETIGNMQIEITSDNDCTIFSDNISVNQAQSGIFIGYFNPLYITCTLSTGETYYGEYHYN